MGHERSGHCGVSIEIGHPGGCHRHVVVVSGERGLAHDSGRVQGRGVGRDSGAALPTLRVAEAQQLLDAERGPLRQCLRGVIRGSVQCPRSGNVDGCLWARHCRGFQIHFHGEMRARGLSL